VHEEFPNTVHFTDNESLIEQIQLLYEVRKQHKESFLIPKVGDKVYLRVKYYISKIDTEETGEVTLIVA